MCSTKNLVRLKFFPSKFCPISNVSDFIALLVNATAKSIHQKCLEFLMIEVYQYLNGLSTQIINDIFKLRKNIYNLKNVHLFGSQNPRRKRYGLDCIANRASQI